MAGPQRLVSPRYPFVPVRIALRRWRREVPALIDTGFSGDIALPAHVFSDDLGLPDTRFDWEIADGTVVDAPLYFGTVEIPGFPVIVAAITILGNEYVVGQGIIQRYRVIFDHGQQVIIEP